MTGPPAETKTEEKEKVKAKDKDKEKEKGKENEKEKETEKEKKRKTPPTGTTQQTSGEGQDAAPQQQVGSAAGQEEQPRAVSSLDIQLVQSLIERCLQLYMNKREVLSIIEQQAKIAPSFTGLVWQQLQEQNPDFFKAYYGRLRLKDQLVVFNQLIERHYHMLRSNPQSTLQLGGQQPEYRRTEQHQDNKSVSVPEQLRQTPLPPQEQQIYDRQHGDAVVSQDQGHQREESCNGLRVSTASIPANDGDNHGELERAQGMVQPLRSAALGYGILAKESTFNDFNAAGGLSMLPSENDGLMGGLHTFPRNFSLPDLSMDLQQANEGEHSLNMCFHDGGEAFGTVGPSVTGEAEIKRNFSLSDVNLEM